MSISRKMSILLVFLLQAEHLYAIMKRFHTLAYVSIFTACFLVAVVQIRLALDCRSNSSIYQATTDRNAWMSNYQFSITNSGSFLYRSDLVRYWSIVREGSMITILLTMIPLLNGVKEMSPAPSAST